MASILRTMGLKKGKHQKLKEETGQPKISAAMATLLNAIEGEMDVDDAFNCKYLGSSPIEQPSNLLLTCSAIRNIVEMAKAKGRKSTKKIVLMISSKHIAAVPQKKADASKKAKKEAAEAEEKAKKVTEAEAKSKVATSAGLEDTQSRVSFSSSSSSSAASETHNKNHGGDDGDLIFDISIYKISFCTCDLDNKRIVGIVSTNPNGSHECHAFKAADGKGSHAIAFAVSRAFTRAFEMWSELAKHCEGGDKEDEEIAHMFMANRESLATVRARLEKEMEQEEKAITEAGGKVETTRTVVSNGNLTLLDLDNDQPLDGARVTTTTTVATTVDIRFLLPPPYATKQQMNFLINFDEP